MQKKPIASTGPHGAAFSRAVGSGGDVGIWHERYRVQPGNFECIYNNMPAFGLGKAMKLVPVQGPLDTAAGRMNPKAKSPVVE